MYKVQSTDMEWINALCSFWMFQSVWNWQQLEGWIRGNIILTGNNFIVKYLTAYRVGWGFYKISQHLLQSEGHYLPVINIFGKNQLKREQKWKNEYWTGNDLSFKLYLFHKFFNTTIDYFLFTYKII